MPPPEEEVPLADDETSPGKALKSLEALIEAEPDGVDPEVIATADALRASIGTLEEPSLDIDPPPGIGPSLPPPPVSSKRKRSSEEHVKHENPPKRAPDNDKMHPNNVFADGNPDFFQLAQWHQPLKPYLLKTSDNKSHTIDFTSWEATCELNRALLSTRYGVTYWRIPKGPLVPPIANRANYIHWIEDLLKLSRPKESESVKGPTIAGLDIGVGANCVYPLLGASLNGWRFVGIDVTDVAVQCARENVENNEAIADLVEIRDSRSFDGMKGFTETACGDSSILLPAVTYDEMFAFCMCNPPFFESEGEACRNDSTNFGGSAKEVSCPGGEQRFLETIFKDSLVLTDKVHWFTTMCGKKSTTKTLKKLLDSDKKVKAIRTTTFFQGKTARWGVAWSFSPDAGKTNQTPIRRYIGIDDECNR